MVLVDTSVWIDYLNGKQLPHTDELAALIENDAVAVCPVIFTELLSGIADDGTRAEIATLLDAFVKLNIEPYAAAIKAADVYVAVRKAGKTIRKHNDCLIAAFAMEYNMPLLHADKDFNAIAEAIPLSIHPPS